MATYVKGDPVANATSYELFEKTENEYVILARANQINFDVSALGLPTGSHILVVKARANDYVDSEYSNEVVYQAIKIEHGIMEPIEQLRGYVHFPTGELKEGNQYVHKYAVIPNTICSYTGAVLGSARVAMASFYDENDNWLGTNGIESTSERVDYTDYEFVIPPNTAYMLCTSYADNIVVKGDYYV